MRPGCAVKLAVLAGLRPEGWAPPKPVGAPEPEKPEPEPEPKPPTKRLRMSAREKAQAARALEIAQDIANRLSSGETKSEIMLALGFKARTYGIYFHRARMLRLLPPKYQTDRPTDTRRIRTP